MAEIKELTLAFNTISNKPDGKPSRQQAESSNTIGAGTAAKSEACAVDTSASLYPGVYSRLPVLGMPLITEGEAVSSLPSMNSRPGHRTGTPFCPGPRGGLDHAVASFSLSSPSIFATVSLEV
jgi:hypothetical protein